MVLVAVTSRKASLASASICPTRSAPRNTPSAARDGLCLRSVSETSMAMIMSQGLPLRAWTGRSATRIMW
ncbi:MAG: hypothetical protein A4E73_01123 [Syntrophaceae bacterium PtaU1.Bin231]|nr:MAG: hypothetical protein A4E73_01123 [Syntrophaceae bacterium PtaU1.Bin231]